MIAREIKGWGRKEGVRSQILISDQILFSHGGQIWSCTPRSDRVGQGLRRARHVPPGPTAERAVMGWDLGGAEISKFQLSGCTRAGTNVCCAAAERRGGDFGYAAM